MDPKEVIAMCSRCGAALKYVFFFNGKPVGGDCFARLTGVKVKWLDAYIDADRNIDYAAYLADQRAINKLAISEAAAQHARIALVAHENAWLIEDLLPYAEFEILPAGDIWGRNFAGSMVVELRDRGVLATELTGNAKRSIINILCKGLRGKKRDALWFSLEDKLFPEG